MCSPGAAAAEAAGPGGSPSITVTGWLLDLYADPQDELALWLLEDEAVCRGGSGLAGEGLRMQTRPYRPRLRLRQAFPITFYAAGPGARLRLLWQYLARSNRQLLKEGTLTLSRQERRDLFLPKPVTVLAIEVQKPGLLPRLFQRASAAFPDLIYYDADLPLSARHAARYGTFPLAKLRADITISAATNNRAGGPATVQALQALDTPWDLDAPPPPLRVMHLSPDCDPRRGTPAWLEVQVETLLSAAEGALSEIEGRQTGAGKPAGFDYTQPAQDALGAIERRRRWTCRLSLRPERALLIGLRALLWRYDPDLLLTGWGDTWLLPHLLGLSEQLGIPLPLNRGVIDTGGADDPGWPHAVRPAGFDDTQPAWDAPGEATACTASEGAPSAIEAYPGDPDDDFGRPLPCDARQPILRRPERSYQAYGQVIYRGQQVLLSGRWHIDKFNAMMFHDYALDGVLESARVSSLPVQQAARLSPGTGISTMQIVTALRQGVMTPWHKQQAELPKSALDLLHADQGGLVYQPIIGLHRDVAEIDFISMYPSIMARLTSRRRRPALLRKRLKPLLPRNHRRS